MKKIVSIALSLSLVISMLITSTVIGASADTVYGAKENVGYLKLCGRAALVDSGIAMDLSGDGVEWTANCSGNVSVTMNIKYAANYLVVWIDGQRVSGGINYDTADATKDATSGRIGLRKATIGWEDITARIASNLPQGTHTFKIAKSTHVGGDNLMTLRSITMNGSFTAKPANKNGYIEFIGDSITSGMGILSHNLYDQLGGDYTDPTLGYAWQTADAFNADRSLISIGGIGISAGIAAGVAKDIYRQKDVYPKAYRYRDANKSYFPTRTPNVVVINLGTNDWMQLRSGPYGKTPAKPNEHSYVDVNGNLIETSGTPQQNFDLAVKTIKDCMAVLLKQVRKYYGNVPIVWCCGMMTYGGFADTNKSNLKGLLNQAISENNHFNIYWLDLQWCKANGNYGMDVGGADHPFYTSHVKNAQILTKYIQSQGWMGTTPTAPTTPKPTQSQSTTAQTTQGTTIKTTTASTTQPTTQAPVTSDTYMPSTSWSNVSSGTISFDSKGINVNSDASAVEYTLYDYIYHSKSVTAPANSDAIRFTLTLNSVGNKTTPLEVYMGGSNERIGKYSGAFVSLGTGEQAVGKSVTYTVKLSDFAGGANSSEKRPLTTEQLSNVNFVNSSSVETTTATTVTTTKATTATTSSPEIKKGDVNGDGVVNALDLQILLGKVTAGKSDADSASDMNNDGKVDIFDVKILLNKIL